MRRFDRWTRRASVATLLAACLLVSSACGSENNQEAGGTKDDAIDVTLVVATQAKLLDLAPLYLAIENGYFTEAGLNLEVVSVSSSTTALSSIVSGKADVVAGSPLAMIQAVSQGQHLQAFAAISAAQTGSMYVTKSAISKYGLDPTKSLNEKVAAMKGFTIGGSGPGSGADTLTRYVLRKYGELDPDHDTKIITLGGDKTRAALVQGQIDGALLFPPGSSVGMTSGKIEKYIDSAEIPEFRTHLTEVLLGTADFIKTNPEAVKALSQGLQRALDELGANSAAAETALREKVYADIEGNVWPDAFATAKTGFAKSLRISEDQIKIPMDIVNAVSGTNVQIPFNDLVVTEYAPA